ncbi:hypothetical protein K0M31_003801 [Melipona bicolor]|uniref:Uncharacterized protein n=1 Tax=Melipona bicolor TaxID=60889 RepID=A0AA40FXK9_9HYME|nr:hypothetical protein K0M31_003801 [Melipona bicolor]
MEGVHPRGGSSIGESPRRVPRRRRDGDRGRGSSSGSASSVAARSFSAGGPVCRPLPSARRARSIRLLSTLGCAPEQPWRARTTTRPPTEPSHGAEPRLRTIDSHGNEPRRRSRVESRGREAKRRVAGELSAGPGTALTAGSPGKGSQRNVEPGPRP